MKNHGSNETRCFEALFPSEPRDSRSFAFPPRAADPRARLSRDASLRSFFSYDGLPDGSARASALQHGHCHNLEPALDLLNR